MAAQLYDEILFQGATFGDLDHRAGPLIVATATDISTGSRLAFTQSDFDLLCSDVRYSYEAVELLKDITLRGKTLRQLRESGTIQAASSQSLIAAPDIDVYAIDVSFEALHDLEETAYLNDLPTSFGLPSEAVDRLRAAAAAIVRQSPEFQRLLRDTGAR